MSRWIWLMPATWPWLVNWLSTWDSLPANGTTLGSRGAASRFGYSRCGPASDCLPAASSCRFCRNRTASIGCHSAKFKGSSILPKSGPLLRRHPLPHLRVGRAELCHCRQPPGLGVDPVPAAGVLGLSRSSRRHFSPQPSQSLVLWLADIAEKELAKPTRLTRQDQTGGPSLK